MYSEGIIPQLFEQNLGVILAMGYYTCDSADCHSEFKTFHQWKALGKSILKGSKAFTLWGSPKEINHPDPEVEDDEFKYWPLCYLFSDKQVTEVRQS
jgi:hypothetical protein